MAPQRTVSAQAWAALFLLGVIWGGSFLAIRTALDEIPPLTSVLHRTFWAALVLWAVVLVTGLRVPRAPRIWGAFLIMGLLNNVIPFSLMAWGQLYVETGLTSIFNASTAIFGVVVASVFLADERLSLRKAIGVAMGFAGVTVAIGLDNLTRFDLRSLAQLAIVAGALSYAFAGTWARLHLSGLSPVMAATGMLTASALVMIPLVLIHDGPPSLALSARSWAAIGYYAVIATALAYLLYYRILAMAGSANLLLVTLIIPPVSITLGAWARNEVLSPDAYAGFALLACGLMVLDGRILKHFARRV